MKKLYIAWSKLEVNLAQRHYNTGSKYLEIRTKCEKNGLVISTYMRKISYWKALQFPHQLFRRLRYKLYGDVDEEIFLGADEIYNIFLLRVFIMRTYTVMYCTLGEIRW